ncbi:TRAP transporter small permease [Acuticoccus mangrovi]|uniref:TRAP transporter small permease protein n=1 Tax=Acuticoccus mangrovi TaxID=2796142 RepID=A0A934MGK8_9HYPH|nr:TRAP transporter small permease subunit [Acuticoccus mangrovi]MBJ3775091.1 TRAP transporter small permease subunit [Acuticoccus mangrovi]
MAAAIRLAAATARLVGRLAEGVAALAFAAMVLLFAAAIASRHGLAAPIRWSDEVVTLTFIWIVFGAAAFAIPYREHIAVGLLYDRLSPGRRRWMEAGGTLAAGLVLAATLPATIDYTAFLWRERTPALMWPLDRAYAVFAVFQGMMALRLLVRAGAAVLGRPLPA